MKKHLPRFMNFVSPEPMSGCWLWTGSDSGTGRGGGYGRFSFSGATIAAHRYAYSVLVGKIRKNMQVDHKCGVRCCVNPDHLQQVTQSKNMKSIRNKRVGERERQLLPGL